MDRRVIIYLYTAAVLFFDLLVIILGAFFTKETLAGFMQAQLPMIFFVTILSLVIGQAGIYYFFAKRNNRPEHSRTWDTLPGADVIFWSNIV